MRSFWSDLKIPTDIGRELANIPKEVAKEVTKAMLSQTERIKDEALTMISEEVRNFVDQLDIAEELRKAMRNSTIELDIKIRFQDNNPEPKIEQQVALVPVSRPSTAPVSSSSSSTPSSASPTSSEKPKTVSKETEETIS